MLELTSVSHTAHTQVSAVWWGLRGVCIGGVGDIKEESDYRKEEKEKGKESY